MYFYEEMEKQAGIGKSIAGAAKRIVLGKKGVPLTEWGSGMKGFGYRRIRPDIIKSTAKEIMKSPVGAIKKGWKGMGKVDKVLMLGVPAYSIGSNPTKPSEWIPETLGTAGYVALGKTPLIPSMLALHPLYSGGEHVGQFAEKGYSGMKRLFRKD